MRHLALLRIVIIPLLLLTACQAPVGDITITPTSVMSTPTKLPTQTPSPFLEETATPEPTDMEFTYWFDDSIPPVVQTSLCFPQGMSTAIRQSQAGIQLGVGGEGLLAYRRVYALATRFDQVMDGISLEEVQAAWHGEGELKLGMSQETLAVFTRLWGDSEEILQDEHLENLISQVWAADSLLLILPFDELSPRLKVLMVDGVSAIDKNLDLETYPLKVDYSWQGDSQMLGLVAAACNPGTNRDPSLMTDVLMTGVSALTRNTAARMSEEGVAYPAGGILDWLTSADITHISHEVSFYKDCPAPIPVRAGGRFCAQREFFELFEISGVDVVELTGNHLNDWGVDALYDSIQMYADAGIKTFGGGVDAEAARQPLLIEDHGNRLAFIGCNSTGPDLDWATEARPGSARCDLDWLNGEVKRLRVEGYLPIVTVQGFEVCQFAPHSTQRDFAQSMAEAGAVIVSGSQAHCPQAYAFQGETLIHYGLGNLWFDQMDWITRQEILDRHVFYNGRHISTEIKTALLEDSARPRPMSIEERRVLLEMVFDATN